MVTITAETPLLETSEATLGQLVDRKRPVTGASTVPTEKERAGDFSQLLQLGARYQIYEPATITPAPGGRTSRQPLAGTIVPAARIDSVASNLLQFYPLPNSFANIEGRNNFIHPIGTRIDCFSHPARPTRTSTSTASASAPT